MRVIVGCEFSQRITKAFREKGHEAYSCDLLPGEINSGWHFQGDILTLLKTEQFDMGIFHPPCTYLSVSGNRWMKGNPAREEKRKEAINFFMEFTELKIPMVCIENPVSIMSTRYRKPDQYIQPYMFGHPESKKTCLWLKGLPKLSSTKTVEPQYILGKDGNRYSPIHYLSQWSAAKYYGLDRGIVRSITPKGLAEAMANQWG